MGLYHSRGNACSYSLLTGLPHVPMHSPFTAAIYAKRESDRAKGKGKQASPDKSVTASGGSSVRTSALRNGVSYREL